MTFSTPALRRLLPARLALACVLASGAWIAPGLLLASPTPEMPPAGLATEAHEVAAPEARSIAEAVQASLIYVDDSATGTNDGSSWTNAYTDLQVAINTATSGDQIWVAQGTYAPATTYQITGARNGVEIYGGFEGTETVLGDRDLTAGFISVLSGSDARTVLDILGNTSVGPVTSAFVLDGFLIRDGRGLTNAEGGGLFISAFNAASSPTIRNVTFFQNASDVDGAGVFINAAGGIARPSFTNVRFIDNAATRDGGAIRASSNGGGTTEPTFTNVTFSRNTAAGVGAVYVDFIAFGGTVSSTFTNVTASQNVTAINPSTGQRGQLFEVRSGTATIASSIIWGNTPSTATYPTTQFTFLNATAISTVENGCSPQSPPCATGDPLFIDPDGADGTPGTLDDDLRLGPGSPATGQGANLGPDPAAPVPLTPMLTGVQGYRMLASPTGGTYDDLLGSIWTQGFTGSDNPSGGCSVFRFDETTGDFTTAYTCLTDQGATFARGSGAYVFTYEDDDLTASGVQGGFPKTLAVTDPEYTDSGAPFTFPASVLTHTDNPNTPTTEEGFNLLGNPLTAGFDWDLAVRGGGLTQSIYVWDPNYLGGDYRTWAAGLGGDLTDGVVPAFQGFFAKAVAANPTLEIPVAAVVEPSPGLYGKTASGEDPLRFELSANGTLASVAFVAASPEAALGEDTFDAARLTPGAWPRTVLSTQGIGEDTPLAINAIPASARGEVELPLEIAAEGHAAGPLALSLAWSGALPEGWTASLVDRDLGTSTALVEGGSYAFDLTISSGAAKSRPAALGLSVGPDAAPEAQKSGTVATTGSRFVLRITPASVTSTGETPEAAFGLGAPAPNPSRNMVRVPYTLSASGEARVTVLDALGREVATLASGAHAEGAHEATLDASGLAPGIYVIRLATPEAASVRRITVVR